MVDERLSQSDLDLFNRPPKDEELLKLSKCVASWWVLAKELNLSDAKIAQIKADHSQSLEQCYQALKTWKNDQHGKVEGKVGYLVLACKCASVDQAEHMIGYTGQPALFLVEEELLEEPLTSAKYYLPKSVLA